MPTVPCGEPHPERPELRCHISAGTHREHEARDENGYVEWPNAAWVPQAESKKVVERRVKERVAEVREWAHARQDDPPNAHRAAAMIAPVIPDCLRAVLEVLAETPCRFVSGQTILERTGQSEGLRRVRELRDYDFKVEARPPASGRGPWEYALTDW